MISLAAGNSQLSTHNSQLFNTPQSLRDSPPILVGQLVCCWLSVVYSSLPGVGRVRQSRERVRKILTASPWGGTIVDDSTPQSLRDSPPILVGQLVCCLLSVVYNSLPKVGRVRRSRERVQTRGERREERVWRAQKKRLWTQPLLVWRIIVELFLFAVTVTAHELIYATSSVNKFLLTSEEWVRSTCDFKLN